jgi:hypothetical protein
MTVSPSPEQLSELRKLILGRIGEEFDGECHLTEAEALQAADALESTQSEIARLTTALHEVRDVAERLSIEAQIAAPTGSECRLRAKMGSCASDLFAALKDSPNVG